MRGERAVFASPGGYFCSPSLGIYFDFQTPPLLSWQEGSEPAGQPGPSWSWRRGRPAVQAGRFWVWPVTVTLTGMTERVSSNCQF